MKQGIIAAGVSLLFVISPSAQAQVTATISGASVGGGLWDYTIKVNNLTSQTFDVVWFSYFPGNGGPVDFLPSLPMNITTQPGWEGSVIQYGGYGIFYEPLNNSSPRFTPHSTLTLGFESADPPSVIQATSPLPAGGPDQVNDVSWALTFTELYDPNGKITPQYVPEPSSVALMSTGAAAFWLGRRIFSRRRS